MKDQDAEVTRHLREQLQAAQKQNLDLKVLLQLGYEVYIMLMPGAKHIAVKDYAAINTFGVKCAKLLDIKDENGQDRVGDPGGDASSGGDRPCDDSGIQDKEKPKSNDDG